MKFLLHNSLCEKVLCIITLMLNSCCMIVVSIVTDITVEGFYVSAVQLHAVNIHCGLAVK